MNIKTELAIDLEKCGFPTITRWSVENNQRRPMSVTGEPTLPLIGELLSELGPDVALFGGNLYMIDNTKKKVWFACFALDSNFKEVEYLATKANIDAGYSGKYVQGYVDDSNVDVEYGDEPEIALAKLYISYKK